MAALEAQGHWCTYTSTSRREPPVSSSAMLWICERDVVDADFDHYESAVARPVLHPLIDHLRRLPDVAPLRRELDVTQQAAAPPLLQPHHHRWPREVDPGTTMTGKDDARGSF